MNFRPSRFNKKKFRRKRRTSIFRFTVDLATREMFSAIYKLRRQEYPCLSMQKHIFGRRRNVCGREERRASKVEASQLKTRQTELLCDDFVLTKFKQVRNTFRQSPPSSWQIYLLFLGETGGFGRKGKTQRNVRGFSRRKRRGKCHNLHKEMIF